MTEPPLPPSFETFFGIVPANNADLLEKVYQLRHQVYCEELGFEPQRATQLEHDEYDQRSIHCLLLHKSSQSYVGCVRLVRAESTNALQPFPFELVCGNTLRWNFDESAANSRLNYGEISRLAIAASFRRRRGEPNLVDGAPAEPESQPSEDDRRLFPSIALGLYVAITAMGLNQGLGGVFAMMEPRLARQLRRFGIVFEQVGAEVDHRGIRAPFFISREGLLNNLKPECRVLLDSIQEQLALAS